MGTTIAVEGLIGVGKTTLCHLLARERGARLMLEPSERNPFLAPFYRDPARYAFPAQMAYLIQRWRQQQSLRQVDMFGGLVATDYVMAKDRLFATKTLTDEELELYDHFAEALQEPGLAPTLLVWLDAPVEVCLERIARRGAPGEEEIDKAYLHDLRVRYLGLIARWRVCPVLRIDTSRLDIADDLVDQATVLTRIDAALAGHVASDPLDDAPELFPTGA